MAIYHIRLKNYALVEGQQMLEKGLLMKTKPLAHSCYIYGFNPCLLAPDRVNQFL